MLLQITLQDGISLQGRILHELIVNFIMLNAKEKKYAFIFICVELREMCGAASSSS